MAAHLQVLPAGRLLPGHAALSGHAALGVGGVVHFIFRLFVWRLLWRWSVLLWHIKTFGPVILLLIVLLVALALILRARRRADTRPRRGPGDDGPGPRDW
ncbi:MAG: hypothetical protein ACLPKI_04940 [Streptosporangiaceae bacterium]